MANVAISNFVAPVLGSGSPDGTAEVAFGQIRPGISLKYNQSLKIFALSPTPVASIIPWMVPPLAVGAARSLIDTDTGIPMPWLLPKDHVATLIGTNRHGNQDIYAYTYVDGFLADEPAHDMAGFPLYVATLVGTSTKSIDPLALTSHLIDIQVVNDGLDVLRGSYDWIVLVEKVR